MAALVTTRIQSWVSAVTPTADEKPERRKLRAALTLDGDEQNVIAIVHNSGKPIPESDLPLIFEPLRQSPEPSSGKPQQSSIGLGLYVAREIIHTHGGVVTVASSPEAGTTFTVRLPRYCLPA